MSALVCAGACSSGGVPDSKPPPMPVPGVELNVTPVFEASRPVADCTASLRTASGPVALAATISCTPMGPATAVGAGVAGAGYVVVSGSRVLSVSAAGAITADEGPASADDVAGLVVRPDGAADLVGTGIDLGVAFFRAADGGWMREEIEPPSNQVSRLQQNYSVVGLGRADDGTVHLAADHVIDAGLWSYVLTRAPSGQWTRYAAPFLLLSSTSALAVRPAGEPVAVHLARSEQGTETLDAWSNGDIPTFAPVGPDDPEDAPTMMSAAADAAGVTVGLQTPARGIVLYRPAGASPRTVTLEGTAAPFPVGCPDLPTISATAMAPRACTETGVGGGGRHALVLTADGTAWVAYLVVHLNRDLSQSCVPNFNGTGFDCVTDFVADRSTLEVVLERVAANGTHTVKWRAPAGPTDFGRGYVFMDRRDALLHVAYSSMTVAGFPPPSVEYAVVDTTKL